MIPKAKPGKHASFAFWRLPPGGIIAGLALVCLAAYHWALQLGLLPVSEITYALLRFDSTDVMLYTCACIGVFGIVVYSDKRGRIALLFVPWLLVCFVIVHMLSGLEAWRGLVSGLGRDALEGATALTQYAVFMRYVWFLVVPNCVAALVLNVYAVSSGAKAYYTGS